MPQPLMAKKLKLNDSIDLQDLLELIPKKDALFITENWNTEVGSQRIPGIIGKFGAGVQNKAG